MVLWPHSRLLQQLLLVVSLVVCIAAEDKLFEKCNEKEMLCYAFPSDIAATAMTAHPTENPPATATTGFRLHVVGPHEWKLYKADDRALTECNFQVGTLKFNCLKDVPTPNPVTITPSKSADGKLKTYVLKATGDSIADLVQLYKNGKTPTMTLTGKLSDKQVEHKATVDATKQLSEYETVCKRKAKPALPPFTKLPGGEDYAYTCPDEPRFKDIFFDDTSKDVRTVYCSDKGWRKDNGDVIEPDISKEPLCSKKLDKLELFTTACGTTDVCFHFDNDVSPTQLTPIAPTGATNNNGFRIHRNDKKWWLTISWPAATFAECKFKLGELEEIDCDTATPITTSGLKISSDKIGRDGNSNQVLYTIISENKDEPVSDVLKVYYTDVILTMTSGTTKLPSEKIPFKCAAVGTAKPGATAQNPTVEDAKYTCTEPKNPFIFLNKEKMNMNAIFCSTRGWRDENHVYIPNHDGAGAFCFRDPKPLAEPIFQDCGGENKECHVLLNDKKSFKKETSVTSDLANPQLGVELDMSTPMNWKLKLAWSGNEPCTFSIGSALTFNCGTEGEKEQTVKDVKVKRVDTGEGKADYSVKYEQYSIEPENGADPVVDALKLYTTLRQKLKLEISGSPTPIESADVVFFKVCEASDPTKVPGLTADTPTPGSDPNHYKCDDADNKYIFLNEKKIDDKQVFCSSQGWRDGNRKLLPGITFDKQTVTCYTDDPPVPLEMFVNCNGENECHALDNDKKKYEKISATPPINHKDPKLGVHLVKTDILWTVTIAREKFDDCKFSIGELEFPCGQEKGWTQEAPLWRVLQEEEQVTITLDDLGTGKKDHSVLYERYTIAAKNTADPLVADALRLYKAATFKMALKGGVNALETTEISSIQACTLATGATSVSVKAKPATRVHNTFTCEHKILTHFYLNAERLKPATTTLYCSQRGWRNENDVFIEAFNQEQPFCYTKADPTPLAMLENCNSKDRVTDKSCFIFDNALKPAAVDALPTKLIAYDGNAELHYKLGLYLDHSNDESWTLTISYEDFDKPSFQIATLPLIAVEGRQITDPAMPIAGSSEMLQYAEQGQDGTVFFHKFFIRPSIPGESLIDNLKLYVKKEYTIALKFEPAKQFETPGITFFPEGCSGFCNFIIDENARPPLRHENQKNLFDCELQNRGEKTKLTWMSIFVNDRFVGGKVVYCSKKGWRDASHNLIPSTYTPEQPGSPMCYNLCSKNFMTIIDAFGKDSTAVKPKSVSDAEDTNYQCLAGKASIKYNDKFYDAVKCADNVWKADNDLIPWAYDEAKSFDSYKFTVECFGAFKFLKGNCDDAENKEEGCEQPTITGDDTVSCSDGFALIYEETMYTALKFVKGVWMDGGNEIGAAVESKKPKCLSKCRSANLDLSDNDDAKLIRKADYQWKEADNTGELKCSVATDILITNAKDSLQKDPYFNTEWKCDAKTKWTSASTPGKDIASTTTLTDLKVTAHCYQACHESKVVNGCAEGDEECAPPKYEDNKLSCGDNRVMFVDDKEMLKPLECTALGWKEDGGTAVLPKYDHTANKEVKLSVQCVDKCGKKFREGDEKTNVKYSYAGNTMTCAGTEMISYTVQDAPTKTTLEDLTCKSASGWNGGNNRLIDFARDGHHFAAKCVPSCTDDRIVDDCNGQPYCEKPTMKSESDLITCAEGTVLRFKKANSEIELEYNSIQCSKKSFENVPKKSIQVPRADPDTNIAIACYSKCDKDFVTEDGSTTIAGADFAKSSSAKNYILECKDRFYYTTMKIDSKVQYTAENFECDPMRGWSARDISKGDIFAEFDGEKHVSKATVGCVNICENRLRSKEDACPSNFPGIQCGEIEPKYDGATNPPTIDCGKHRTMRYNKQYFIQETLECTDKGYKRKSTGTIILDFENTEENVKKTVDIYCHPNCRTDLVTLKPVTDETTQIGIPKPDIITDRDQYKSMDCTNGLLVIETGTDTVTTTRVFGKAMCEAAKGWTGKTAQTDFNLDPTEATIVDFTKVIRLTAYCFKVCDASNVTITSVCTEKEIKEKLCEKYEYTSNYLKCSSSHRLFFHHGEEEDVELKEMGPMTCAREGWKRDEETDKSKLEINFKDPNVALEKIVKASCRHKCHEKFITQSNCRFTDSCSPYIYNTSTRLMTCSDPNEILILKSEENPAVEKESFVDVECTDAGWKKTGATGELLPLAGTKYSIQARCEKICHESTLSETDKNSRSYKLGGVLTCEKKEEKLIFKGNDWYTDLTCSKEKGWISDTDSTKKIAFAEGELTRQFDAKCMPTVCTRDRAFEPSITNPCAGRETECGKPDFETKKYFVSCQKPMQIIRRGQQEDIGTPVHYTTLKCGKDDAWRRSDAASEENSNIIVAKDAYLDLICWAGECANCKDEKHTMKCNQEPYAQDINCEDIKFAAGSAGSCSQYQCSNHFRWKDGTGFKYFYYDKNPATTRPAFMCHKGSEFYTPDGKATVGAEIGCVKHIPCIEHSPLKTDVDCAARAIQCDIEGLKAKLVKASKKTSSSTLPVTCEDGKQLLYFKDTNTPIILTTMTCNEMGQWAVAYTVKEGEEEKTAPLVLPAHAEVVCSANLPPTTTPTPTPPPTTREPSVCALCGLPEELKCKGCSNKKSKYSTKTDGDKCILSTTERFGYNDGSSETTDDLTCVKDKKTGLAQWKTKEGKVVKSFAIKDKKITDDVNMAMIGGVIGACLLILLLITGAIVFFVIRRKREKERLETLKSKGLEIKNDTIIDQIDVDDPKTLKL